ncbi:MAG: sugar ABC transporter permease [Spirochaetales bacterium]|nr:sugar ABC transporter permease [Spirochaetales bacterium]
MMANRLSAIKRRELGGFIYIIPWIIGFLFFQLFPIFYSLFISFTKWDILQSPEIIGFKNYIDLFGKDRVFRKAITNTIMYMFISNGLGIILAFFLATLLYEKIPGRGIFKVVFFLPNLVLPVAFGLMMRPVFGSEDFGLINQVIGFFGIKQVYWLEDANVAIWVLIFTNLWFVGACAVIFLAAISGHPPSLYEAAEIDGAGWWRKLFSITLPLLTPVIFFQIIMGLISGLQVFDIAAALSVMGGNVTGLMGKQNCLATLVYYLYIQGFRYWKMGTACSIGWVIFTLGFILTFIIVTFMRKSKKLYMGY